MRAPRSPPSLLPRSRVGEGYARSGVVSKTTDVPSRVSHCELVAGPRWASARSKPATEKPVVGQVGKSDESYSPRGAAASAVPHLTYRIAKQPASRHIALTRSATGFRLRRHEIPHIRVRGRVRGRFIVDIPCGASARTDRRAAATACWRPRRWWRRRTKNLSHAVRRSHRLREHVQRRQPGARRRRTTQGCGRARGGGGNGRRSTGRTWPRSRSGRPTHLDVPRLGRRSEVLARRERNDR